LYSLYARPTKSCKITWARQIVKIRKQGMLKILFGKLNGRNNFND
jgi:hypothetical protein